MAFVGANLLHTSFTGFYPLVFDLETFKTAGGAIFKKFTKMNTEVTAMAVFSASRFCSLRKVVGAFAIVALAPTVLAAELATTPATQVSMPEELGFDGRIEAVNQSTVSAETRGRIEEIRVDIGDRVSAGTVILTMTNTEQRAGLNQAEANLAEAQANLLAEDTEFQRLQELFGRQFVSKADLDWATARLNTAKARVDSAEAAIKNTREQLSYTEVKAPYGGILSARYVEPGEAVQPGTVLMSGYDPNILRVEVDVPQSVAERIAQLRHARIVTATFGNTLSAPLEPAKLILYPMADPASSTVRVRMELSLDDAVGLYPGQFVKAMMKVGETQRLLIPASAVVHRSEVTAVYVVENGKPQLRQIRPGALYLTESGKQLAVLAGLTAGELVARDPVAAAIALTGGRDQAETQASGEVQFER